MLGKAKKVMIDTENTTIVFETSYAQADLVRACSRGSIRVFWERQL